MPEFLEKKLLAEYGVQNKHAVYGTMQKRGYIEGGKETPKGEALQAKHERDMKANKGRTEASEKDMDEYRTTHAKRAQARKEATGKFRTKDVHSSGIGKYGEK